MNPQQTPQQETSPSARADDDSGNRTTPNTDMQPEDAGTTESGNDPARGNAAETVLKQTSKTGREKGPDGERR